MRWNVLIESLGSSLDHSCRVRLNEVIRLRNKQSKINRVLTLLSADEVPDYTSSNIVILKLFCILLLTGFLGVGKLFYLKTPEDFTVEA